MQEKNENNRIIFADLFAGIGGFHYAFNEICHKYNIKSLCKYVSEIDKYAKENYAENFSFEINKIFDINDFEKNTKSNLDLDVVFCGFPCQPFSNAGFKKGFEDPTRGELIFKVIEFVKKTKPKIILLENVKHIVKHNNGKTIARILKLFEENNYVLSNENEKIESLIFSPDDFSLEIKQKRQRIFLPFVRKDIFNKYKDNKQLYVVAFIFKF